VVRGGNLSYWRDNFLCLEISPFAFIPGIPLTFWESVPLQVRSPVSDLIVPLILRSHVSVYDHVPICRVFVNPCVSLGLCDPFNQGMPILVQHLSLSVEYLHYLVLGYVLRKYVSV
jgi:hypothetical protein